MTRSVGSGTPTRDIMVIRDSVRLTSRLSLPHGPGPFACAIFVHGLGSSKESPRNVTIAQHLLAAGIATLLFDLSGHGGSERDPHDGTDAYVLDLEAAFKWAAQQPELDSDVIGVAGSSLGGVVALQATRRGLIRPAAMVLRAPPAEPPEFVQLSVPTLIVIGSADPLLEMVLEGAGRCEAVTLCVIRGAGHLFEEPGALEAALDATGRWFRYYLSDAGEEPPDCGDKGGVHP